MSIRRGIRIGFCGAGGTGKTTSAEFISNELQIPMLKSSSRIVYEAKSLTEEKVKELANNQKLALQKDIFDIKVKNDRSFSYVADRTVLDHYAYCLAYCGSFMPNDKFLEWEEMVHNLMLSTYTHIFYFPWGYWSPEKKDGVRMDLFGWQSQIDAILVGYLNRWNIQVGLAPQMYGADARNEFIKKAILGEEG